MSVPNFAGLRALSDEQLIALHDESAVNVDSASVQYCLQELARRDTDRQTAQMLLLTKVMALLTVVITVLTIVNVVLVARSPMP